VAVDVPSEVRYGLDGIVKITIAGKAAELWAGAGFVSMVHSNHGVVADPATFEIRCDGTKEVQQLVKLRQPEPPPNAHLYRLVVMILLNNHWHWSCRLVSVRR
jgi:hypothetical protein